MRFSTRTFALCFILFTVLIGISFWAVQSMVQKSVREQLRSGMRDHQVAMARQRAQHQVQSSRLLRFAGENAALKAGLQLLNSEPENPDARRTVEDQLNELGTQIGCQLLSVVSFNGARVALVLRGATRGGLPIKSPEPAMQGLWVFNGELYQLMSVPIDQGSENLGYLTIGDRFDLGEFGMPVVLFQHGQIIRASYAEAVVEDLARALKPCIATPECDFRLNDVSYLSVQMSDITLGDDYVLRSLQNIDAAAKPVHAVLKQVFTTASLGALLIAFVFSFAASRSIVQPLVRFIYHLQKSEAAGHLSDFPPEYTRITEIRELIKSFNAAAASTREARHRLSSAYVAFIGSLANALDARDPYTAGHSVRVSRLSTAIAEDLQLEDEQKENIRIGALLHDIGKIGVPDYILSKPGALTDQEFATIKKHPTIGRRILEGVNGFSAYLAVVELHHENWDGSGYPSGIRANEVPLDARIVHVADAWDAMTTDRPYRRAFDGSTALAAIRKNSGSQFDPQIVEALIRVVKLDDMEPSQQTIVNLAAALQQRAEVSPSEIQSARRSI